MYGEAEQMNAKVCMESCFACLTAYLTYLCFDTYFDKVNLFVKFLFHCKL